MVVGRPHELGHLDDAEAHIIGSAPAFRHFINSCGIARTVDVEIRMLKLKTIGRL